MNEVHVIIAFIAMVTIMVVAVILSDTNDQKMAKAGLHQELVHKTILVHNTDSTYAVDDVIWVK